MELHQARDLLDQQGGVVARRQLSDVGAGEPDLRRWLRRRELVAVHPGVYINHRGPLTWTNLAWAATLLYAPAALCHASALNLAGEVIHVAISHHRNPARRPASDSTGSETSMTGCSGEFAHRECASRTRS